jgi:hypothetical protein
VSLCHESLGVVGIAASFESRRMYDMRDLVSKGLSAGTSVRRSLLPSRRGDMLGRAG